MSWSRNYAEIGGLSRFNSYQISVKKPGYREHQFHLNRVSFNLYPDENRIEEFSAGDAERESGTVTVSIYDSKTGRLVQQGKPPSITLQRRFLFVPIPFSTIKSRESATATFTIDRLGRYYVSVWKQLYTPPLPRVITVFDDFDPRSASHKNIRFNLENKSIPLARTLSTIYPGLGQLYLGRYTPGFTYAGVAAVLAIWFGYEYSQYMAQCDKYDEMRIEYEDLGSSDWADAEVELEATHEELMDHRQRAYYASASYLGFAMLNVITIKFR